MVVKAVWEEPRHPGKKIQAKKHHHMAPEDQILKGSLYALTGQGLRGGPQIGLH